MARLVSMNYCLWLLADREAPDHNDRVGQCLATGGYRRDGTL